MSHRVRAKLAVSFRIPRTKAPWRSVVLRIPNAWFVEPPRKLIMRQLVLSVADKHGISRKRTRVVERTGDPNPGCYGYVHVFRGRGTKAERTLFKRVYRSAMKIDVASVRAFVAGMRLVLAGDFDGAQRRLYHLAWTSSDRSRR